MGNVIEINGKKYDAATGKLLDTTTASAAVKQDAKVKSTSNAASAGAKSGISVDGMVRRRTAHTTAAKAAKPVQKSQTLMRTAVKKPVPITKNTSSNSITKAHLGQSKKRQMVAAEVPQSPLVSHFGNQHTARSNVVKKVGHLPVKQPSQTSTLRPAPHHAPPSISQTASKVGKAASHASVEKKNLAAAKLIESALASADAHEQLAPAMHTVRKRHRLARRLGISARAVAISSTVLAGVLLGGFFAVQNVPNLSMRVAATQAGFDATLPAYSPSGFSFKGPINYSPGQVTVSFKSGADDRTYDVTQRASNWNSEALLANFVLENKQPYQAYEDRGRTLFIYGKSNATWVDNGIWYQIEGNSQLSTDQLIRIAGSM